MTGTDSAKVVMYQTLELLRRQKKVRGAGILLVKETVGRDETGKLARDTILESQRPH